MYVRLSSECNQSKYVYKFDSTHKTKKTTSKRCRLNRLFFIAKMLWLASCCTHSHFALWPNKRSLQQMCGLSNSSDLFSLRWLFCFSLYLYSIKTMMCFVSSHRLTLFFTGHQSTINKFQLIHQWESHTALMHSHNYNKYGIGRVFDREAKKIIKKIVIHHALSAAYRHCSLFKCTPNAIRHI